MGKSRFPDASGNLKIPVGQLIASPEGINPAPDGGELNRLRGGERAGHHLAGGDELLNRLRGGEQ